MEREREIRKLEKNEPFFMKMLSDDAYARFP